MIIELSLVKLVYGGYPRFYGGAFLLFVLSSIFNCGSFHQPLSWFCFYLGYEYNTFFLYIYVMGRNLLIKIKLLSILIEHV